VSYTVAAPENRDESCNGGGLGTATELKGDEEGNSHQGVRAVTLTASASRAFITSTAPSPAFSKTLLAKHHAGLHRERSEIQRDGVVQDGGGNLHERRQEKGLGRATKHGLLVPMDAGWAL
jgi:hypothetical protein